MTARPARVNDAPLPMIHGRLVYLRPQEPDDVALVHRWYLDAETASLMGDMPRSLVWRQRRFAASAQGHGDDVYLFIICRLGDGEPLGRIDLFDIDRANGSAAFGIAIGEARFRGQGYGGDAVDALVDFCFAELRLERLWLLTDDHNHRAQRVYQRAGFTVEARERRAFYQDGRFTDDIRMSMLRHEWEQLPRRSAGG